MAASDDDPQPNSLETAQGPRKRPRRTGRSCDHCRRRKIRCDGLEGSGGQCTSCAIEKQECTFALSPPERGPSRNYITMLESRLEKMEKFLLTLMPREEFVKEFGGCFSRKERSFDEEVPVAPFGASTKCVYPQGQDVFTVASTVIRHVVRPPSEEDLAADLAMSLTLKVYSDIPIPPAYFGKSSGVYLIRAALDAMAEATSSPAPSVPSFLRSMRSDFWSRHPWELNYGQREIRAPYIFPEEDLILSLVDLYFQHMNLYIPLLHRPTFFRRIAEGAHLSDRAFGTNLLLVCAIGSRWSNDPRVLYDNVEANPVQFHGSGWKWVQQITLVGESVLRPNSLDEIQSYCLLCTFLSFSACLPSSWSIIGIGIRLAQEVGAHRKRRGPQTSVEAELWRRLWWSLIFLDTMLASRLGRPTAFRDEDTDLDLPIECDDEYWEHEDPEQAFKQPPHVPSLVVHFVQVLQLSRLVRMTLRTIYPHKTAKEFAGAGSPEWDQHVVSEVDSALNKFVESLPSHLRWDPEQADVNFFLQSAHLHSMYYFTRMLVHRPYITNAGCPSVLTFPSLAICTSGARSCIRVAEVVNRRMNGVMPFTQHDIFTSGVLMMLNIWTRARSSKGSALTSELEAVGTVLDLLQQSEERWIIAGRFRDMLTELIASGDLTSVPALPSSHPKRSRDSEGEDTDSSTGSNPAIPITPGEPNSSDFILLNPDDQLHVGSGGNGTLPIQGSWNNYSWQNPFEVAFDPSMSGMSEIAAPWSDSHEQYQNEVSLWSNIPTDLTWENWDAYIGNFEEMLAQGNSSQAQFIDKTL